MIHRPKKDTNITELVICKVRMGLPGREQMIKLAWQWQNSIYLPADQSPGDDDSKRRFVWAGSIDPDARRLNWPWWAYVLTLIVWGGFCITLAA